MFLFCFIFVIVVRLVWVFVCFGVLWGVFVFVFV